MRATCNMKVRSTTNQISINRVDFCILSTNMLALINQVLQENEDEFEWLKDKTSIRATYYNHHFCFEVEFFRFDWSSCLVHFRDLACYLIQKSVWKTKYYVPRILFRKKITLTSSCNIFLKKNSSWMKPKENLTLNLGIGFRNSEVWIFSDLYVGSGSRWTQILWPDLEVTTIQLFGFQFLDILYRRSPNYAASD